MDKLTPDRDDPRGREHRRGPRPAPGRRFHRRGGSLDTARDADVDLAGTSVVVLGRAGGAAPAPFHTLGPIAGRVVVAARHADAAAAAAGLAPDATAVTLDDVVTRSPRRR